jgi:thiol:disulfide interchange protein
MNKDKLVNLLFGAMVVIGVGLLVARTVMTGTPAPEPPMFQAGLSFHEAAAKAQRENKPLFVVFSATWCGPCQSYQRGALVDPGVEQWMGANAVAVHVDVDEDSAAAEALGVTSIPVTILMRGNAERARITGALSAGELRQWLELNSKSPAPAEAPAGG